MISQQELDDFANQLRTQYNVDLTDSAKQFISLLLNAIEQDGPSKWPFDPNLAQHSKEFRDVFQASVRYYAGELKARGETKMTLFHLLGYLREWVGGFHRMLLKINPTP